MLLFGALYGEDRFTRHNLAATAIGVTGLVLLCRLDDDSAIDAPAYLGIAAVIVATIGYCWGAVLGRPLLRRYPPLLVAGWSQLLGGTLLLGSVVAFDFGSLSTLPHFIRPRVFLSWAFLVGLGSIVAYTFYLRLLHHWSPHRAGMFAFVSPAIAVGAGVAFLDERVTEFQLMGMALMLIGTVVALRRPTAGAVVRQPVK